MRDDTKHATEVEQASRKVVRATSEADVGTHLSEKEVITDAFSNNEANTQDIERGKIFRTKFVEKMVFSKESSCAISEMGNVELIELNKSSIQCPSCLHHVFEGTLLCKCGTLVKPDRDVMNRIKEDFEIPKAPYHSTAPISTRGSKCGNARDAFRSYTRRQSIYFNLGQMAK